MAIVDPLISAGVPQALAGFGRNIGSALVGRSQIEKQERERDLLSQYLQGAAGGDESDLLNVALRNPQLGSFLIDKQTVQRQQQERQLGLIANQAKKLRDPDRIRMFLQQQAQKIEDPELKAEIIDTIQMPDESMLADIDLAISSLTGLPKAGELPPQQRVQSSQILPDGATIQILGDGSTRVTGPQGDELTGQQRQKAIEDSKQFGIDVQAQRASARTGATEEEKRASKLIGRGIASAESTATIRRGLELLDRVETGGVNAVSLAVKQRLGIEGADEGELSNSLGKSVLSQLRETFGAAFTQEEGQRLARIEAGFGKSVATNKRLLNQALRIAERTAKRARASAERRGDIETVQDIDDLLTFELEDPEFEAKPATDFTDEELSEGLGL